MPKAFMKINCEFTLKPGDNVTEDHNKLCSEVVSGGELELGVFEDEPNLVTTFLINSEAMQEGSFDISTSGGQIKVVANGIAEVSVGSNFMDKFLSTSGKWRYSGLSGPWLGEVLINGLERVDFKTMRRGQEIDDYYFKVNVKTGKSKSI